MTTSKATMKRTTTATKPATKNATVQPRARAKAKNLAAIVTSARAEDRPSPKLVDRVRRTQTRAELALSNLAAAKRIAKVSTREVAKAGSHAVLIVPDAHFPFNDEAATDLAIKIAEVVRPTRIVSLGDTIEAAAWTAHPPRSVAEEATHKFSLEIEQAGAWIDRVRDAAGTGASWAYLEGNHEAHVERECLRLGSIGRAVADLVSPKNLLMRGRPWLGWTPYVEAYNPGRRAPSRSGSGLSYFAVTSDLWAIHGWSLAKNFAQKNLELVRNKSVCSGHAHRIQSVTERDPVSGKLLHSWSPGCLSKLQPAWAHAGGPTAWSHGVSIAFCEDECLTKPDPRWTPYTITISRGEAVLPGGTSLRV